MRVVFTVLDSVAGVFCNPYFSNNKFTALRDFCEASKDPQSQISKYPSEYVLYEIGNFDEESGVLLPHDKIINLGNATQFNQ